ncbi:VOC family protein [Exiguobacterium sp. s192]|uniref:VOC family protein n=1 Tax=Exiguobacterium sp. s192 TaxID=2751206 RepID=UPI001BED0AB1|nr:VOC family protein [Exiguobacterium sp. s192]
MVRYGYTILYITDPAKTRSFYHGLLGLPIKAEHGSYTEFETGTTVLASNTKEDVRSMIPYELPDKTGQQSIELGFVTDDVQQLYETIRAAGHETILPPTEKPWGQIVAYVLDPDGHLIELCSPVSSSN